MKSSKRMPQNIQQSGSQGCGLQSQFPRFRYFSNFLVLSKHMFDIEYFNMTFTFDRSRRRSASVIPVTNEVHLLQVSPTLKQVRLQDRKFHFRIDERKFSSPRPRKTSQISRPGQVEDVFVKYRLFCPILLSTVLAQQARSVFQIRLGSLRWYRIYFLDELIFGIMVYQNRYTTGNRWLLPIHSCIPQYTTEKPWLSSKFSSVQWASCQIRKITGWACAGNVFPAIVG